MITKILEHKEIGINEMAVKIQVGDITYSGCLTEVVEDLQNPKKDFEKQMKEKLRVWWSQKLPITKESKEEYLVENIEEAKKKFKELTQRDLRINSVTDNVGGLEIFEKNYEGELEWSEYYDEEGKDIDKIIEGEKK